jgi:hypothetical protein
VLSRLRMVTGKHRRASPGWHSSRLVGDGAERQLLKLA